MLAPSGKHWPGCSQHVLIRGLPYRQRDGRTGQPCSGLSPSFRGSGEQQKHARSRTSLCEIRRKAHWGRGTEVGGLRAWPHGNRETGDAPYIGGHCSPQTSPKSKSSLGPGVTRRGPKWEEDADQATAKAGGGSQEQHSLERGAGVCICNLKGQSQDTGDKASKHQRGQRPCHQPALQPAHPVLTSQPRQPN